MPKKHMSKSEFADYCGVSPGAITAAIRGKKVRVSTNGSIDSTGKKNAKYYHDARARKEKSAKGRSEEKKKNMQRPAEAGFAEVDQTETDYSIEKMRSATALNKAKLAQMVRATIRRDFVDEVIGIIGTTINDHLIPMGDRLSPEIAAIVGSTDPSVTRQIKEALDQDVSLSLTEMKRAVKERYEDQLAEQ